MTGDSETNLTFAEAHDGVVRVHSTLGKGTLFTVTLPPYTAPSVP